MSLSPEQQAARRLGIGGSEIASLFGLDKFKTPFDTWLSKTQGWEPERNDDMMRGTHLEDGVARWYAEKHAVEVVNPNETMRHATRPIVLATPDRLINTAAGGLENLSIKCPRGGDEWGESETEEYPMRANLQVQWEAAVLASRGYVLTGAWIAALVWGELRRYPVRLDVELQERLMRGAEQWWAKYVTTNTAPPIDGGKGASEWLLRRHTMPAHKEKTEASLQQEALCLALREAEAAHDAAEKTYDDAKARVLETIGDGYGLTGSFGSITWSKNQYGTRTFRAHWKKG